MPRKSGGFSMKRILAAIDGSEASLKAVDLAAESAALWGAELLIVTVAPDPGQLEAAVRSWAHAEHAEHEFPDLPLGAANRSLGPALSRAAAKGVTAKAELASGDPTRGILESAQQHEVDAIYIGSRGRGQLAGLMLGSVSQKVASHAPCTVVIVR